MTLAACATPNSTQIFTATNDESSSLFALMRKAGVGAIENRGELIVLPEFHLPHGLEPMVGQPRTGGGGGSGGAGGSTPTPAPCDCYTYDASGNPVTYNGIPIIINENVTASNTNVYADTISIGANYGGGRYGPAVYGPRYVVNPPPTTNCAGEAITAIAQIASSIGAWMVVNQNKVPPSLMALYFAYAAGELTATGFIAALLGISTMGEFLLIIGAVGLAIGAIYLILKCLHS